jgi:hypothetical protein
MASATNIPLAKTLQNFRAKGMITTFVANPFGKNWSHLKI